MSKHDDDEYGLGWGGNGMQDFYEYSRTPWNEEFGSVKFNI